MEPSFNRLQSSQKRPRSQFLDPKNRKYPYKNRLGVIDCDGLHSAQYLGSIHSPRIGRKAARLLKKHCKSKRPKRRKSKRRRRKRTKKRRRRSRKRSRKRRKRSRFKVRGKLTWHRELTTKQAGNRAQAERERRHLLALKRAVLRHASGQHSPKFRNLMRKPKIYSSQSPTRAPGPGYY